MIKVKIYTDKHIIETVIWNVSREELLDMVQLQLTEGSYIKLGDVIVDREHFIALEFSENL